MQSVSLNLHIIDVFQMKMLIRRTFFFNEQETKYISIYLKEDLKSYVKFRTSSGHVVLNDLQWFILVTFKSNRSKNLVTHVIRCQCTVDGVYVSRVRKVKFIWAKCLVTTDGFSEFCRTQDESVEWRDKYVESKCFCSPPNTNAIDLDTLWDELTYKNLSCNK